MPVDPKRVQAVFLAAVGPSDPASRAAVLDRECGADAELRGRVEALLKANDKPDSFLGRPAADAESRGTGGYASDGAGGPESEGPGSVIGPYKLLQQIGEGGMGVVYMAEQERPVRRRVALKVIKPGMDSKQVIARFEAERQALAMMDHLHIAKVLDAGSTEAGRPFFVMELVRGIPITRFCDQEHLTPRERLELFVPVCQAVQHAHQKGVIHRDLKPSNILVTLYDGKPVPKVIDFGVAKALHTKLTDRTMFTEFGAVVGTLEYMSPEQAEMSGLDVDTRSDVYSLGVLLYELLTGTTPFEKKRLRREALAEVLRIIHEEEPPKPSTRLSQSGASLAGIAAARKTEPAKLTKLMRGELDWIVMKALEKDRARRYETANSLARDVQRYLADEPVEACPPSAGYRLRKLARRYRTLLATAAAFAALLVTGAAVSTGLAVRATRAEDLAQHRLGEEAAARAEAEAVRDFFVDDMIGSVAPERKMGRPVTVDEVLAGAERAIGTRFKVQPLTEATVRLTLGRVYRALGQYDKAEGHLRRAQALYTEHGGSQHRRTLETMAVLGSAFLRAGRIDEAARILEETLQLARPALGPEDTVTLRSLNDLSGVRRARGNFTESEALLRQVLNARLRLDGDDHLDTITVRLNLAITLVLGGNMEEAQRHFEEAAQAARRALGPNHPLTLMTEANWAETLSALGQDAKAIPLLERILEHCRKVFGPDHSNTITVATSLASCLASRPNPSSDNLTRALALSQQGIDIRTEDQEPLAWNIRGTAHYQRGDWKAALTALETAEKICEGYSKCRNDFFLAMTHQQLGNKAKARPYYDRAAEWMDERGSRVPELVRFRAKAAAVLGLQDGPKPDAR